MRPLTELYEECGRHLQALSEAMQRCPSPLTLDHFRTRNPDLIATLDQFAYRFSKLQDVMSVQLFRQFAVQILKEPVESVPIIDILNLLERYRFLDSVQRWQEIREIRNQIAHEYHLDIEELILTLRIAFTMVDEMAEMIARMKDRSK